MGGKTDQIKGRIKEAAGALSILTGGRTTKRRLVVALLPLCAGVLLAVACTGPAGPAGPTGMTGAQGSTGMTGVQGSTGMTGRAGLGWDDGRTGPGRNHRGPGRAGVVAAAGGSVDVGEGVHV